MMRRRRTEQKPGAPLWMVTFSDLMTLLLVFFVLLFASSKIDAVKFKAIAESFQQRAIFDFYPSVVPFDNPSKDAKKQDPNDQDQNKLKAELENKKDQAEIENEKQLEKILKVVNQFLKENQLQGVITATREEKGVVLVLQEQVLFHSGEATILPEAKPFLNKVTYLLKNIPNTVKVEGHTDNVPISTYRFPSNWELSTARASSVIRYFTEQGIDPQRLVAVGYGEYQPIAPNDTPEGRQKNRRVVIVIAAPNYTP
ncbi:flagellar motor protein MotS [Microaerobacter geothermalis]|uniref:flagellar motor protein MotS n=1 Tax=Microaerobacter geothermalis TaxID=674972 RepID=UPI002E32CB9D|nr:flagellar motor protein MotS [Microaerobacter geothermalis]